MRTSRFTEQQVVAALRQAEGGTPVQEVGDQRADVLPLEAQVRRDRGGQTAAAPPGGR